MKYFILAMAYLVGVSAWAAAPDQYTFQTRIVLPNGNPLEAASVTFRFTILDKNGTCVLYVEDFSSINMAGSNGVASFQIGNGFKQYPSAIASIGDAFINSGGILCQSGSTYNPGATDNRQIVMQFNDGSGWQTLPQMAINGVPYSSHATKADNLGAYPSTAYLRPSTLTSCTAGQALHWDGTSFSCVTASGGGGGPAYTGVTSISNASGDITLAAPTSTGKIIISSNTPSTNTTTGAVVVTGGMGVSGTINSGSVSTTGTIHSATTITASGDITTGGTLSALTSIFTPQIYGTTAASGALRLDGTSNATAGNVLIATAAGGGNVGVGTTNPTQLLHVSKSVNTSSGVAIENLNSGSIARSDLTLASDGGSAGIQVYSAGYISTHLADRAALVSQATLKGLNITATALGGDIRFTTNGGAATDERMRIDSSGNVGIGTTTPNAKLEVSGAAISTPNIIASGGAVNLALSNVHLLKSVGGNSITLTNPRSGGSYTIVVSDTTQRTYSFTGCTNSYFSPANGQTFQRTSFSIMVLVDSGNTDCYINWVTGYEP